MIWRYASALAVALALGCAPRPPSASAVAPAIERALEHKIYAPEATVNGVPGYDWRLCGTRVRNFGTYDKQRHSWPVRATTCCSLRYGDSPPDSITAIYRLTRNEFGEWVAEFTRWEEYP